MAPRLSPMLWMAKTALGKKRRWWFLLHGERIKNCDDARSASAVLSIGSGTKCWMVVQAVFGKEAREATLNILRHHGFFRASHLQDHNFDNSSQHHRISRMLIFNSLVALAAATIASAARLTVSIPGSQLLPNPSTLPSTSHAVLLGPPGVRYDVPIRRDNTFVFPDLPEASYLLTVHTRDFFFLPLRVDIQKTEGENEQSITAWQTFRGNEWNNKGSLYGTGKDALTVEVRPSSPKDYYQTRGGFSIVSFLKSPMILMGLVSVVMIFGFPYLMDNMDPEMKAEFEEMQKKSPVTGSQGAANTMQNFDLAGFLAGRSSTPDPSSAKKK